MRTNVRTSVWELRREARPCERSIGDDDCTRFVHMYVIGSSSLCDFIGQSLTWVVGCSLVSVGWSRWVGWLVVLPRRSRRVARCSSNNPDGSKGGRSFSYTTMAQVKYIHVCKCLSVLPICHQAPRVTNRS